mgnify:CR=1 FL=1
MTEQEQINLVAKEISYVEIFCDDNDIYLKDILSDRIIEGIAVALVRAGYVPCENEEIARLREEVKNVRAERDSQMLQKVSAEHYAQRTHEAYMKLQQERCNYIAEIEHLRSLGMGMQNVEKGV